MNIEGNESFTHTEKFKKWANPSRARDSRIAILAFPDRYPLYIDLLHLFVSPQNYFMLCVTNGRVKRRSVKVIRAPQDRLKKTTTTGNPGSRPLITQQSTKYLFQLRKKNKMKFSAKFFSLPPILRRAE